MKKLFSPGKIYISQSKMNTAGRGVFALSAIQKGELIETCPVLEISPEDTAQISEYSLVSYMYYFGKKKERSLIALGFGSIYNHSYTPNAAYTENHKDQTIAFRAIKDINKNEEIVVNYGQENKNENRPLWFAVSS